MLDRSVKSRRDLPESSSSAAADSKHFTSLQIFTSFAEPPLNEFFTQKEQQDLEQRQRDEEDKLYRWVNIKIIYIRFGTTALLLQEIPWEEEIRRGECGSYGGRRERCKSDKSCYCKWFSSHSFFLIITYRSTWTKWQRKRGQKWSNWLKSTAGKWWTSYTRRKWSTSRVEATTGKR